MAAPLAVAMTNAQRILTVLSGHLDHPVELTLFGRAALALGFPEAPEIVERSLDVDVIIPVHQVAEIEADSQFWEALDRANRELAGEGLYLTHLFEATQIALTAGWVEQREPIQVIATERLRLFRPGIADLILTKMMRGADEDDLADIRFLVAQPEFQADALVRAIEEVRLPDVPEIRELFAESRDIVLDLIDRPGE